MAYELQFTEQMVGAFAFDAGDYRAGYDEGLAEGSRLAFRLTIAADDVDAMISQPGHPGVARGAVLCEALGGRLPVTEGRFDLFVDEGPRVRHMLYRLYFADATGRPLTLAGYKDVHPGPLRQVWPETSTLYTKVLSGHEAVTDGGAAPRPGVVGAGVLRIRPLDFARQLTTFRVHGPRGGRLGALDRFGRLFLGELWQVFDPLHREPARG